MGHLLSHGSLNHGRSVGEERVGLEGIGTSSAEEQLLEETVKQQVLVDRLHHTGAHGLHVVDGGGQNVRK